MGKKKAQVRTGVLPEIFVERMKILFGAYTSQVEKTFVERPTTFRINHLKVKPNENVKAVLAEQGFKFKEVPWNKGAFILQNKTKRELTDSSIYMEGKIYIQSLASMVPPLILQPQPGEKVLDLTAAPGSKTSQMADMMQRTGELVANDVNKVRFFKLKHNMELLGVAPLSSPESGIEQRTSPQPSPTRRGSNDDESPLQEGGAGDAWKFILRMEDGSRLCGEHTEYFDKILLDAPCSAEARFVIGDVKSFGYWSEKKIKEMADKQRKLLFSAWHALKPGGTLVYSTCTFAPEENEVQVSKLLERFADTAEMVNISSVLSGLKSFPVVQEWKNKKLHPHIKHCLRILPNNEIEGFFVACLRKKV